MENLVELNQLLLEQLYVFMDTTDEKELSLLDVLTDACMEIEQFLQSKTVIH